MSQNTDMKMIPERDAVLREREAFRRGARAAHDDNFRARVNRADSGMYRFGGPASASDTAYEDAWRVILHSDLCDARAAASYPLPKVTRPRIVRDPHEFGYWKAKDGDMLNAATPDDHEWVLCGNYGLRLTAERVRLWADLLANPTEEVDADA